MASITRVNWSTEPDQLAEAIATVKSGDREGARILLAKVARARPRDERVWLWRASLAQSTTEALTHLQEVLRINPSNEAARAWYKRIKPEQAEPSQHQCPFCGYTSQSPLDRCPQCRAVTTLNLDKIAANPDADERQLRHAITHYSKLINEHEYLARLNLAIAYLNLRQSTEALEHLKRVAQLRPDNGKISQELMQLTRRPVVLVVDDSPTVRTMISRTLERNRYRAVEAGDGVSALARLESVEPHLILLDVTMPVINGNDLCKMIRNHPKTKGVPVVMLTGKNGFIDKIKGRMAGASEYLTKPIEPARLVQALGKYAR